MTLGNLQTNQIVTGYRSRQITGDERTFEKFSLRRLVNEISLTPLIADMIHFDIDQGEVRAINLKFSDFADELTFDNKMARVSANAS